MEIENPVSPLSSVWPLCCGSSSPNTPFIPRSKNTELQSKCLLKEREPLPSQGLCLISRMDPVIKAYKDRTVE